MLKKIFSIILICLISFTILFGAASAKAAVDTTDVSSCTDIFGVISAINIQAAGGKITGAWDVFGEAECITWGVINFLLIMGAVVAAFFIILGGINYMLAVGNATKQQAAVKTLNAAVIGFALLLVSWSAFSYFVDFMEYNNYVNQAGKINLNVESP